MSNLPGHYDRMGYEKTFPEGTEVCTITWVQSEGEA